MSLIMTGFDDNSSAQDKESTHNKGGQPPMLIESFAHQARLPLMQKIGSHLSSLAELASLMKEGKHIEQFAAICHRDRPDGTTEVLLITTRETGRWTVPKGWDIKGLKPHEVAERESWEEAGVVGKAKKKPFGRFTYVKTLKSGRKVASFVQVHLVHVETVEESFPELGQRERVWVTPTEAASMVPEPELKHLLSSLTGRPKASA
jgi:8-oxo-dGTP pyrophosphatase MutT (NUDIX family)